jgi:nucleotide-binding universal stress UspA family protein
MKILVAVDGSEYTKRMLAYIAAHDEWLGGAHDYTVIHSVLAVPHHAASFVGPSTVRKFYEEDAEAVFRPIRAFFEKQGIKAGFVHTVGHAADSIAARATEGRFDLVILGSHGHGEVANLVLGSVATKVLARCSVPVLIVR